MSTLKNQPNIVAAGLFFKSVNLCQHNQDCLISQAYSLGLDLRSPEKRRQTTEECSDQDNETLHPSLTLVAHAAAQPFQCKAQSTCT